MPERTLSEPTPKHLPLSDVEAGALAGKLQFFGGRVRLRLLWELADGEARVKPISRRLRISAHEVRKQLRTLRRASVVQTRQQGELVFYRVEDPVSLGFLRSLRDYHSGPDLSDEEEMA